jgi:signal transduction histidine kinase
MSADAASAHAAQPAAVPERATGASGFDSSYFESSTLERNLRQRDGAAAWIGWRRRALVIATLLGCLGLFAFANWLAGLPRLDARWAAGPGGELVLIDSRVPVLAAQRGRTLLTIAAAAAPRSDDAAAALQVDSLLLLRSPRWQVDDAVRARQVAQHAALAALLDGGRVRLQFDSGAVAEVAVPPGGYAGLGLGFWPLAGLALLLVLFAVVVISARPQRRNLLYVTMCACQACNLLFIALEGIGGLGLPAGAIASDLPVRVALDLCTGAALVHAFALHPKRLAGAGTVAAAAWSSVPIWLLLASVRGAAPEGALGGLWWWAQAGCVGLGAMALAVIARSYRQEPNPYALVMRRFAVAGLATLVLVTLAVAATARPPTTASAAAAAGATLAWYLFFALLLLLTPFLSRSRQVLREFAMLAGISALATSLDLLFVVVFSLGTFTSLAIAMFVALALYAGLRQWLLGHLVGSSIPTTERTFDLLYRAAREVQARPASHPQQLGQLLRELFDPLELLRVERVPARARIVGGGSALVVPMRGADVEHAGASALVLRFAQRGKRLFTLDDARLADRVVDQLRRAVAYDLAVERGRSEERQRIAQDLHDDIGARLLTLMYRAQTPEMEDYVRNTLKDLKTLTRGLAASEHRLSHAAAEWKADLTQRLNAAHVGLGWSFTSDRDLRLSVVQWSALTRVLRELVSNALYHGRAARIDVTFALEGPALTLQVADDGRGREPQHWSHGLGLGGVRKRVKLLGGRVEWRENDPAGIVCSVSVPEFTARG